MFLILSLLLTYALLTFGAVRPHDWLTLFIAWIVSGAIFLAVRLHRTSSLDLRILATVVLSGLVAVFLTPNIAVGMLAAAWAYIASDRHRRITRFFHFLIVVGVLEALLGLIQHFVSPGWILGYQSPFKMSSGTLINRNHFAGLLEMLTPVAFGMAYLSAQRFRDVARSYVYILAGAFMGLALVFSLSKMGIISFLATVMFLFAIVQFRQHRLATVLGLGVIGLVLAGALWIGVDLIVERYALLLEEDAIMRDGRLIIYRDTLRMMAANPWGVGTGQFRDQFRPYQSFKLNFIVDHAHNDYLETAAEWGLLPAVAFWAFLFCVLIRNVRNFTSIHSAEERGMLLACSGSIFSILLHSLADFNLQIPSNAMVFFTFVGISLALPLGRVEQAGDRL